MERLQWLETLEDRNLTRAARTDSTDLKGVIYKHVVRNLQEQNRILKQQLENLKRQIR